jgi:hypothetical protein
MGLSIYHWLSTYRAVLGLDEGAGAMERSPQPVQPRGETFEQVTLIRGIAARLAQEMALSNCSIFDVAVLAEVMELPFEQAWPMLQPMALVTSQLLRQLSRRRPLKRSEGTWLSFQIAYLRALDGLLHQEVALHRPWLDAAQVPMSAAPTLSQEEALETASLKALIETLRPQRLTDTQAEQALTAGAQSLLVQQIRQVMVAWLSFNGAEEREAQLLIQRLEHGLAGHLLATIAENATPLAQLQKFVRLGYLSTWNDPAERDYEILEDPNSGNLTIEPQRELYRAKLLQGLSEPLLGQVFSLKDLYVPPMGEILSPDSFRGLSRGDHHVSLVSQATGAPGAGKLLEDVLDWATYQLGQTHSIPVIEAEPGQGKTSFCQMFAVRIAQELYPTWMPIVISLRGLTLGATLEETLAPALPSGLFTAQESWLSAQNPPAVLILDGLDELPLGPDGEGQISQFLWQIKAFQRRYCGELGKPRHRLYLTSRPDTFEMLVKAHPELNAAAGYQRLRLVLMDQDSLRQWFRQWAALQTKAIAQSYFNFLKNGGAFRHNKSVQELRLNLQSEETTPVAVLAHQPFTLMLMAILHRDGFLDDRIFNLSAEALNFEIFERLNSWLMGAATDAYPQPGMIADLSRTGPAHACRTPDAVANLLAGRSPRLLRQQIQTAAFRLHQSGRGQLSQAQLRSDWPGLEPIPAQLPALSTHPARHPSSSPVLSQAPDSVAPLPNLYFIQDSATDGSIRLRFKNPALGDYNCAEAIAFQLQTLTQRSQMPYGEAFTLGTDNAVAEHLYRLLGHGPLTPRLISFILERLRREARREPAGVSLQILGDRLYDVYRYYCRGRWLEEGLPRQALDRLQQLNNPFSLLQVDAAVGLNVFALLCAIAQETQQPFWPCGNPQHQNEFNPNRLLQFIARTASLSPLAFWVYGRNQLSGLHLSRARLSNLMLAEANLQGCDCQGAALMEINLEGADLRQANLAQSNLLRANLGQADLRGANLQGTDLRWANLIGANLAGANLANACLAHAHLDAEGTRLAQATGAFFSVTEYEALQQLARLEDAMNTNPPPPEPKLFYADETLNAEAETVPAAAPAPAAEPAPAVTPGLQPRASVSCPAVPWSPSLSSVPAASGPAHSPDPTDTLQQLPPVVSPPDAVADDTVEQLGALSARQVVSDETLAL